MLVSSERPEVNGAAPGRPSPPQRRFGFRCCPRPGCRVITKPDTRGFSMTVLIAGGGIGGLTLALSLHQIGIPARVFESVAELKPLGVGINVLPHAVRELSELGLLEKLDVVGLIGKCRGAYAYALVDRNPAPQRTLGRVRLMGDAARPIYPIGSN